MPISDYVEKQLISKRFILAILITVFFLCTGNGEALVGAVIGFYFGEKAGLATPSPEGDCK